MTSIQQLLQREPASSATNNGATSGFAETYAQAAHSASQAASLSAKTTPTEQSATKASANPVEPVQQNQTRSQWLALFNGEAPVAGAPQTSAPEAVKPPLMTEQPIDPAQSDASPSLEAIAVAAPQLAATTSSKPVSGQPTMTEQPIATSQTDKVAGDLKAVATNPAQAVPIDTAKPSAEQPAVREHTTQPAITAKKLTTEQLATAATTDSNSATRSSAVQAAQIAAPALAKGIENEMKQAVHSSLKPNQPVQTEQLSSSVSTAPQVVAIKAAPIQPAAPARTAQNVTTQSLTPAFAQPIPQQADLDIELANAPELMRQNSTAATPQEQLLAAQVTKDTVPIDAAKFSLGETANPNTLNATQSVAQNSPAGQQPFIADTAGTAPQLTAKLGTQAWQQQLSQQVSQLVLQSDQSVALRLHPAELGSLMMQMKVEDGAAQLSIQSGNAQVRQALEQALPQLRDALANQGIDLGQTHVGSQSARDFGQQSERHTASQHESASDSPNTADNTDNDPTPVAPSSAPAGTLDLYA